MKNKQNGIAIFFTLGVVFVAFNIITFVVADEFTRQFWSGYSFIIFAWICLVVLMAKIIVKKEVAGYSLFLIMPRILIALIYFLFQMVFGIAVMVIPDFSFISSIVIQILLAALFFIAELGLSLYKGISTNTMEQRCAETSFKEDLLLEMANAMSRCKNSVLRQRIENANELLKYSDPVSSLETSVYEQKISDLFSQIKANIYNEEQTMAISYCEEIVQLIKQRDAVCAASKKH